MLLIESDISAGISGTYCRNYGNGILFYWQTCHTISCSLARSYIFIGIVYLHDFWLWDLCRKLDGSSTTRFCWGWCYYYIKLVDSTGNTCWKCYCAKLWDPPTLPEFFHFYANLPVSSTTTRTLLPRLLFHNAGNLMELSSFLRRSLLSLICLIHWLFFVMLCQKSFEIVLLATSQQAAFSDEMKSLTLAIAQRVHVYVCKKIMKFLKPLISNMLSLFKSLMFFKKTIRKRFSSTRMYIQARHLFLGIYPALPKSLLSQVLLVRHLQHPQSCYIFQ